MTMDKTILFIFLCIAVEAEIGKHTFIRKNKKWRDAQDYCREKYSDLSFVSSQRDQDKLLEAAGNSNPEGWIGLYRKPGNITHWKWSGGGDLTYKNWDSAQPDNFNEEYAVEISTLSGKWNDDCMEKSQHFYCITITVVEMRKSWEEALEHCQETETQLPSLISEVERIHTQNAIQLGHITDPVWIGLRYLNDHWLWINNDSLAFEDWPKGDAQDHQCPVQKRCGALTKNARWENRDCQDKLNFICV